MAAVSFEIEVYAPQFLFSQICGLYEFKAASTKRNRLELELKLRVSIELAYAVKTLAARTKS